MKKILFLSLSIITATPQLTKTLSDKEKAAASVGGAVILGLVYVGYNAYQTQQEQQKKNHVSLEKALLGEQPKKEQEHNKQTKQKEIEGLERAYKERKQQEEAEKQYFQKAKDAEIEQIANKQLAEKNEKIQQEEAALSAAQNQKWNDFTQELFEILV